MSQVGGVRIGQWISAGRRRYQYSSSFVAAAIIWPREGDLKSCETRGEGCDAKWRGRCGCNLAIPICSSTPLCTPENSTLDHRKCLQACGGKLKSMVTSFIAIFIGTVGFIYFLLPFIKMLILPLLLFRNEGLEHREYLHPFSLECLEFKNFSTYFVPFRHIGCYVNHELCSSPTEMGLVLFSE